MPVVLRNPVERVFNRAVRHARWLGRVPVLPQFADALAQVAVALTDPARLRAMRTVERTVAAWPGVTCGLHRFGGVEFRVAGREIAHLHGCGLLDVRLGRDQARQCVAAGRAEPHHVFGDSVWVSHWVRTGNDIPSAVELLALARDS